MKTRSMILIFLCVMVLTSTADAGTRNLTGNWNHEGTLWTIAHIGNKAGFSTSSYNKDVGRVTLNFDGFVSGSEDRFSYRGIGEPIRIRVSDDVVCRLDPSMRASGYVSGEIGGRIIHMRSCSIFITARCIKEGTNESRSKSFSEDCSGTWR